MENGMNAWIVGRVFIDSTEKTTHGVLPWTFQGVFLTEDEAVAACRDHLYFIAPTKVGEPLPHEPCEWPGARFPSDSCVDIRKIVEGLREHSKEVVELASVSDEELAS